jgi:hypothetical protein
VTQTVSIDLSAYATLESPTFTTRIYTPAIRNLLNEDLVIDAYNDTGAGTHFLHKFTPFDGKLVLATNGGGLTFPDSTTQVTAFPGFTGYAPLSSPALTGNVTIASNSASAALTITQDGAGDILRLLDVTGDTTFTFIDAAGKVNTVPSTTASAGLNVPHATAAPTAPINGDIWSTTAGLFAYINGATKQYADLSTNQTFLGNNTFGGSSSTFCNGVSGGTVNLGTGATLTGQTKNVNMGTGGVASSSTNIAIGPTSGWSTITIGQSVPASTLNLATGATASGSIKTVNLGTLGVAGSTTNIAIGSTTGTSTTTLQGITNGVTKAVSTNNTELATTAYVKAQGYATTASLSSYLLLTGGTMDNNALLSFNDTTTNSNLGINGNGVVTTLAPSPSEYSQLTYNGLLLTNGADTLSLSPTAITFPDATTQTTAAVSGIGEAPIDGSTYGRLDGAWAVVSGSGGLTINDLSNGATSTLNATVPTTGQALTYDGTALVWATISAPVTSVAGRTGAITLAVADVSDAAPTASPALTGNVTITTNSASPALVIVQDGAGDVVQFKDVSSDSTYSFINSSGKVNTIASTTANAGFNIPLGVAPTSPVTGDMWATNSSVGGLFLRGIGTTREFVSAATLGSYAPLASPVFTGDARCVTPATSDNDTSIATTAFVKAQAYLTDAPSDSKAYVRQNAAWLALVSDIPDFAWYDHPPAAWGTNVANSGIASVATTNCHNLVTSASVANSRASVYTFKDTGSALYVPQYNGNAASAQFRLNWSRKLAVTTAFNFGSFGLPGTDVNYYVAMGISPAGFTGTLTNKGMGVQINTTAANVTQIRIIYHDGTTAKTSSYVSFGTSIAGNTLTNAVIMLYSDGTGTIKLFCYSNVLQGLAITVTDGPTGVASANDFVNIGASLITGATASNNSICMIQPRVYYGL